VYQFTINWKSAGSFLDEQPAHHIYAVIEIPSEASPQTCLTCAKRILRGRMRGTRMTRKPRRRALSVPVRHVQMGSPKSLGRFTDMLYDKSLEKDNCGFGLIAHIEGEPSHKVVRTAIHALARMQHRGAILADGKTGDGCGLLLQKPDRFFRIVA